MQSFLTLSVAVCATLAAAVITPAAAQAVGNVISSTPVMKRVTETPRGCKPAPQRGCELITQDRIIGYKVVYEYNGKQHEVQLPFPVGATISLETSSSGVQPASTPSVTPTPSYESPPSRVVVESGYRPEPRYVEPRYVEPRYVEPRYVEQRYVEPRYVEPRYLEPRYVERVRVYDDPYYYSPAWPAAVVGLTLGYVAGSAYWNGPRGYVQYRDHSGHGGWRGHRR
ncbi:MAG: hypothetical protein H7232_18760 [Aeromicrobium sp.]|nr:hypothetical protein [Burkholderiales bacterium]